MAINLTIAVKGLLWLVLVYEGILPNYSCIELYYALIKCFSMVCCGMESSSFPSKKTKYHGDIINHGGQPGGLPSSNVALGKSDINEGFSGYMGDFILPRFITGGYDQ
jgi:hypothetical protein